MFPTLCCRFCAFIMHAVGLDSKSELGMRHKGGRETNCVRRVPRHVAWVLVLNCFAVAQIIRQSYNIFYLSAFPSLSFPLVPLGHSHCAIYFSFRLCIIQMIYAVKFGAYISLTEGICHVNYCLRAALEFIFLLFSFQAILCPDSV